VPYKIVAVSFMGKKEIEWSSYKKVPQAVVNNVHICDSPEIFKQLWPVSRLLSGCVWKSLACD